ncbi:MAG: hypothetical protein ACTSQY_08245, partial [Candidatus Odinarchaeia archaeon]
TITMSSNFTHQILSGVYITIKYSGGGYISHRGSNNYHVRLKWDPIGWSQVDGDWVPNADYPFIKGYWIVGMDITNRDFNYSPKIGGTDTSDFNNFHLEFIPVGEAFDADGVALSAAQRASSVWKSTHFTKIVNMGERHVVACVAETIFPQHQFTYDPTASDGGLDWDYIEFPLPHSLGVRVQNFEVRGIIVGDEVSNIKMRWDYLENPLYVIDGFLVLGRLVDHQIIGKLTDSVTSDSTMIRAEFFTAQDQADFGTFEELGFSKYTMVTTSFAAGTNVDIHVESVKPWMQVGRPAWVIKADTTGVNSRPQILDIEEFYFTSVNSSTSVIQANRLYTSCTSATPGGGVGWGVFPVRPNFVIADADHFEVVHYKGLDDAGDGKFDFVICDRGQEGTDARSWAAGTPIHYGVTLYDNYFTVPSHMRYYESNTNLAFTNHFYYLGMMAYKKSAGLDLFKSKLDTVASTYVTYVASFSGTTGVIMPGYILFNKTRNDNRRIISIDAASRQINTNESADAWAQDDLVVVRNEAGFMRSVIEFPEFWLE